LKLREKFHLGTFFCDERTIASNAAGCGGDSKKSEVIDLMRRSQGATLAEIIELTGVAVEYRARLPASACGRRSRRTVGVSRTAARRCGILGTHPSAAACIAARRDRLALFE
jgi:hypothetical protein